MATPKGSHGGLRLRQHFFYPDLCFETMCVFCMSHFITWLSHIVPEVLLECFKSNAQQRARLGMKLKSLRAWKPVPTKEICCWTQIVLALLTGGHMTRAVAAAKNLSWNPGPHNVQPFVLTVTQSQTMTSVFAALTQKVNCNFTAILKMSKQNQSILIRELNLTISYFDYYNRFLPNVLHGWLQSSMWHRWKNIQQCMQAQSWCLQKWVWCGCGVWRWMWQR